MNLETRARAAAHGLRSATEVDTEVGLARIHQAQRRRSVTRVAASVAVVAGLVGGVATALDEPQSKTRTVYQGPSDNGTSGPVENGIIVDSIDPLDSIGEGDGYADTPPSELAPLTDAGTAPYPVWQAFDQDTGRFLFTGNEGTGSLFDDTASIRVLAPGADAPVATIECERQCHWPAFGPGPDEVTALVETSGWPPSTAHVYGLDGSLRDEISLSSGVLKGSGIADIAWSPDGSRLAVSTFTGSREPYYPVLESTARLWIFDSKGGHPVLVHRQDASRGPDLNPPLLQDLAWAPGGERLALIVSTYYPERADPPRLVTIDVDSGTAQTIHEFDDCGSCNPARYGFAWSPDGARIAVTDGDRIAQLSSDGTMTFAPLGSGSGPLAWLLGPSN